MSEVWIDTYYRVDEFGQYQAGPFWSYADAAGNQKNVAWRVVLVPLCGTQVPE